MLENFTASSQQVVALARDEAMELGHNYIGTEHILLGLLRERSGVAALLLISQGVTYERMQLKIIRTVGRGVYDDTARDIPFTPRAKRVLELAEVQADFLNADEVDTEHILLGIVDENEGAASDALHDFDLDSNTLRRIIHARIVFNKLRAQLKMGIELVDTAIAAIDLNDFGDEEDVRVLKGHLKRLVNKAKTAKWWPDK